VNLSNVIYCFVTGHAECSALNQIFQSTNVTFLTFCTQLITVFSVVLLGICAVRLCQGFSIWRVSKRVVDVGNSDVDLQAMALAWLQSLESCIDNFFGITSRRKKSNKINNSYNKLIVIYV